MSPFTHNLLVRLHKSLSTTIVSRYHIPILRLQSWPSSTVAESPIFGTPYRTRTCN
ncbi:hypothetical protein Omen_060 [Erwinia phage Omen]|uniref:Uncharacterized protein n=2 Tax=Caudoviricetes TaxID=2731619 RepID=A0AAU8EH66_9CAUD